MTLVTVTAAKGIKVRVQASDNWWTSMSPEQQEAYLREHPESKMGGANSRRYEGEDDSVEAPKKNGTSKDTKPKSNKTPTETYLASTVMQKGTTLKSMSLTRMRMNSLVLTLITSKLRLRSLKRKPICRTLSLGSCPS